MSEPAKFIVKYRGVPIKEFTIPAGETGQIDMKMTGDGDLEFSDCIPKPIDLCRGKPVTGFSIGDPVFVPASENKE